jgi:hypothetical protein
MKRASIEFSVFVTTICSTRGIDAGTSAMRRLMSQITAYLDP